MHVSSPSISLFPPESTQQLSLLHNCTQARPCSSSRRGSRPGPPVWRGPSRIHAPSRIHVVYIRAKLWYLFSLLQNKGAPSINSAQTHISPLIALALEAAIHLPSVQTAGVLSKPPRSRPPVRLLLSAPHPQSAPQTARSHRDWLITDRLMLEGRKLRS